LPPREALAVMDCLAQPEAPPRAEPRDGAPPGERLGIVRLGRVEDRQRYGAEPLVGVVKQCASAFETLLHGGGGNPRSDASAVGLSSELRSALGEVVLTMRLLDGCEACRPVPPQMQALPEQVPRGPQRRRLDGRLGQQAAA